MRAGVLDNNNSISVAELPFPEMGDYDVMVENIYAEYSSSDCRPGMTGEFGNRMVGRVIDMGMCNADFNLGERVYAFPAFARSNGEPLGAMSEYVVIENAIPNMSLFPLPDSLTDRRACLIQTFAEGCNIARSGMLNRPAGELVYSIEEKHPLEGDPRYSFGEKAVVFGTSPQAFSSAIALKWFGMTEVMVCGSSDFRLQLAANLGMKTCHLEKEDFTAKAAQLLGKVHCWIDFEGTDALPLYQKLGRNKSRFVAVKPSSEPLQLSLFDLIKGGRSLLAPGPMEAWDIEDAIEILQSRVWDIEGLITHEYAIEEISKAAEAEADTEHSGIVLIHF